MTQSGHEAIVPTPELGDYLSHVYENYPFSHIVMGDGTNHKKLQPLVKQWIARNHGDITFSLTDEKFTTVEGRKLYFKYTPRKLAPFRATVLPISARTGR